MAEIITAAHDADEAPQTGAMQSLRHNVLIGLGCRQFNIDGLVSCLCLGYQVGQRQVGIGACHEVGTVILQQVFLHALGHTAQHTYNQPSSTFHGVERLQPVVDFLFGIVAHRTGIQEHGISLLNRLTGLIASHLHD